MLQKFVKNFESNHNENEIERTTDFVAQINALETEFDLLVYGLYGLTEEEIGIVEGR